MMVRGCEREYEGMMVRGCEREYEGMNACVVRVRVREWSNDIVIALIYNVMYISFDQ